MFLSLSGRKKVDITVNAAMKNGRVRSHLRLSFPVLTKGGEEGLFTKEHALLKGPGRRGRKGKEREGFVP